MPGASSRAIKREKGRPRARPAAPPPAKALAPDRVAFERLGRIAGPSTIAVAAVAMVAWTWRTWPDPIVDYGRELYAAWQVSTGKTLYVDVVHFCGPLSVYLNAFFVRIFGPSVATLAVVNGLLTAAFTAVLYGLLVRIASRLAATAACVVFVTLFASAQYTRIGNYNWICPYAHEITHGTMLVVAALWCVDRYHRTGRAGWIAAAGLAMGGVALTKAEPLFAGTIAMAVALVLTAAAERPSARRAAGLTTRFAGGALAPLALAFAWFLPAMPVGEILRWPLGHWRAVGTSELVMHPAYLEGFGLDDVGGNLEKVVTALAWAALVGGIAVGGATALRRVRVSRAALVAVAVVSAVILGRLVTIDGWLAAARPLPVYAGLGVVAWLWSFVRHRADPEAARLVALRTAFAVFALAMLTKMALNVRIFHYGFVLAMPAAMLLVIAAVEWIPAAVQRRGGHGALVRAVALGAVAASIPGHLVFVAHLLEPKVYPVADGADTFFADNRALLVNELVREIRARSAPDATLVVLPDGIILNYLARRRSSTPYYSFDMTSRALWGEDAIEQALETHAPDWIVILDRGTVVPNSRMFGRDNFKRGYAWITTHYRRVRQVGATPFQEQREPGAVLMQRIDG